jgi:butyryl-CoA:acetate CoA-transferase
MDFIKEYQQKLTTPEEAVKAVKSGDWVDYGSSVAFPVLLDKALAKRKGELKDVKVRGLGIPGPIMIAEEDPERESFTYNSWHMVGYERKLCDRGLCNFIPMVFRNLPLYYRRDLEVNVAMVGVTPMDKYGYFNLSVVNNAERAVLDKADIIILEVNENLPKVYGLDEAVHISEVDYVVEGKHDPLFQLPSSKPSPEDEIIAGIVVDNMTDGACVQLGIGGMPDAVGSMIARSDLKDLGIHTEMLVNANYEMYKAGKITNKNKSVFRGKSVFGFAMGTQELYDWVEENPSVMTLPIDYINSTKVVSEIDNFVSINNCISVDLFGQITAESAGVRHISGTGGQLDFLDGAYANPNGKSFICLTSTFTDKKGVMHSRIMPTFNGDIVTDPRSQSYNIVTEYGMANLAGRSTWERAEALIGLAHPDFREELIKSAEDLGIWRKSNK